MNDSLSSLESPIRETKRSSIFGKHFTRTKPESTNNSPHIETELKPSSGTYGAGTQYYQNQPAQGYGGPPVQGGYGGPPMQQQATLLNNKSLSQCTPNRHLLESPAGAEKDA
ncbi:hypothetical protein QFC21_007193 [Naganishia friedmannii]|uniref:Uncharacterized protein n=1 Tax=Naganishia friedmannii TaxID=89922 RepID=A0ACC2UWP5_9TREE|nr:hypothetical protein QFC21_007193 [Naganishia friedmannii]